ncbi:carbohydrate kinase family protein [Xinfangfangia sp. CPCC 101601]|uniref:Carbohydrate kinase family protein n=1 Tax=Pseudogemmobacter lacusdianii TaxID=3069608 RepID=A0ABU0VZV5_9RHOB|nr:carbohydrate kinase family protein [Xinfangfangia sp. CPCC 101601]MDQ2067301.1 carbohydrate kinase family protein [Xinfangfangia sp. CPCC 101601]
MSAFFIGDVALDEYYTAERWPGVADKDFVQELPAECGGSIANAAVVHAALGGKPEFISLLNDSPLSDRLIADLQANGVSTRHMLRQAGIPDSRNLIFLVGGEHVVLTVEMGQQPMPLPPATMEALRQPGLLYTTLYRVRRLVEAETGLGQAALLADLRQHGRKLIFDLDVGGADEADLPYLTGAEVVIFNEVGFRATFGADDLHLAEPWRQRMGITRLIRTMAADGAEALDRGRVTRVRGLTVGVVDVTGAGDTFGAALASGLDQGQDFDQALEFSVAAASRSVTIHGPRGGKATRAEVMDWLAKR